MKTVKAYADGWVYADAVIKEQRSYVAPKQQPLHLKVVMG